ncbi:MAG: hypothetical protein ACO3BI_05415 [Candidatus Nanopelagicales bacterium]
MGKSLYRNHNHKQPIDRRNMMIGRLLEDHSGFTLTRMIKEPNIDSETFLIVDAPIVKTASEQTKTRLSRLVNLIGVKPGEFRDLQVINDETGLTVRFENLGRKRFRIHLNGYLKRKNAGLHDQVIIRFVVLQNRVTGVILDYINAFDKGMDKLIDEFFELEERKGEFNWMKLEYLLDRLLHASKLLAQHNPDLACATIDIGSTGNDDRFIYIQWEWLSEESVQIEIVGPRHANPQFTPQGISNLRKLGWNPPEQDGIPNFSLTFSGVSTRDIANFYVKSLKTSLDVFPTDPIFIEPLELLELLAPKKNTEERIEQFLRDGIRVDSDVRISEKWIHAKSQQS